MKIVVMNGAKVNFDGAIDYHVLGEDVVVYDTCTAADYPEISKGAEVIISKELPMSAEDIMKLPDCVKLIAEAGTGYNNIDLDACRKRGIGVCNVPAYSSERVAHTAIMLMLNLASSMQKQITMLAKGDHRNFDQYLMVPHVELNGKTVGVIGAGHIGSKIIKAALGLDMKVIVYSRSKKDLPDGVFQVSLEELLQKSDFVALSCALNAETKHIINEETLKLMKPGAFLINTARGALVDEAALVRALKEGRIAGAGLDVQEVEPAPASNPLFAMDNVILTPHMGWKGFETRQRLVRILKEGIDGYTEGRRVNRVD